MHLDLSLTSEDYEQFTDKITSKYQSINRPNINEDKAEKIDKQIQDFAQKLCGMYQKFYPIFHKTHYQHGMYLALINNRPSNVHSFHQEKIDEEYKIFREFDPTHWLHTTSTAFEALLMNLRKLIVDTSKGKGKAISMKRICKDIKQFHINIKANNNKFSEFEEKLEEQIEIATAPEREELWVYIDSYNMHLEDRYSIDTNDTFHVIDLEILMDSVRKFINEIYDFYDYKEPAAIAHTGFQNTQRWIAAFSSFKRHSLPLLSKSITALATFTICPEYKDLSPREASDEIFKKEVLEKDAEHNSFKMITESYLEDRIKAFREELGLSESSEE